MDLLDDKSIQEDKRPHIRSKRLDVLEKGLVLGIVFTFIANLLNTYALENFPLRLYPSLSLTHPFFALLFVSQWRKASIKYDKQTLPFSFRIALPLKFVRLLSVGFVIYSFYQDANVLMIVIANLSTVFVLIEVWSLPFVGWFTSIVVSIVLFYYYYLTYSKEKEFGRQK